MAYGDRAMLVDGSIEANLIPQYDDPVADIWRPAAGNADGQFVAMPKLLDALGAKADTASTLTTSNLIQTVKQLRVLLAGGLPAALAAGGGLKVALWSAAGAALIYDATYGLGVDIKRMPAMTGAVTADTELPPAAALADGAAGGPTTVTVGAILEAVRAGDHTLADRLVSDLAALRASLYVKGAAAGDTALLARTPANGDPLVAGLIVDAVLRGYRGSDPTKVDPIYLDNGSQRVSLFDQAGNALGASIPADGDAVTRRLHVGALSRLLRASDPTKIDSQYGDANAGRVSLYGKGAAAGDTAVPAHATYGLAVDLKRQVPEVIIPSVAAVWRSGITAADVLAAPGTVTTSLQAGGSAAAGTYTTFVVAGNSYGRTTATLGSSTTITAGGNLTVRAAFAAVAGAEFYDLYNSTDGAAAKFVGRVTEAQRASGILISAQNVTSAGGVAGAVDIQVAGTGLAVNAGYLATNTAYTVETLAGTPGSIDPLGAQYFDLNVSYSRTGDSVAASLVLLPFYAGRLSRWFAGDPVVVNFGGVTGASWPNRQTFRLPVRGRLVVVVVAALAGTGASCDLDVVLV